MKAICVMGGLIILVAIIVAAPTYQEIGNFVSGLFRGD